MGKRFLLVTASIGSGHEKAANAIAAGIESSFPGAQLEIVDFMSWRTSAFNALMKSCYLKILAFVPNLYEFMYQFTAGKKKGGFIQLLMAYVMSRSIKKLLRRHQPDVLICTHPFPAEAASHLGSGWRRKFLSAAVITDYSVHQMWICPNMDLYFVGCEFMKKQLVADGIAEETIHVTGIPVDEIFHQEQDKAACREALALELDRSVVLVMGGGLGLGNMIRALEQLESLQEPLQILVAAGRNHKLRQRAEQLGAASHHSIRAFGYTDRICLMMGAADILVTKPGALTLTEAVSLHLPMVLHEPIPGPETDNARYMSGSGAAVWLHAGDNLAYIIRRLLAQPVRLADMALAAEKHSRPAAVQEIMAIIKTKTAP
ncbi:MAG: glycosyltransferase [Anaerovibrio sp.]|nr:glycosyltransferase [Anaerovibrio sp.]